MVHGRVRPQVRAENAGPRSTGSLQQLHDVGGVTRERTREQGQSGRQPRRLLTGYAGASDNTTALTCSAIANDDVAAGEGALRTNVTGPR